MISLRDKLKTSKRIGINSEHLKVSDEVRMRVCRLARAGESDVSTELFRLIICNGIGGYILSAMSLLI